jgi:predicted lipid-binding transport protein (Tim44 family)
MIAIHYIGWISLNYTIIWIAADLIAEAMKGMFSNEFVGKAIGYAAVIHMIAIVSIIGHREIKEWRKMLKD